MISFIPDLRHPFLRPPGRNPMPTLPRPSPGRDYGSSFDILGTAHFTRRSILDSIQAASSGVHSSVAIELDKQRFDDLDVMAYSVATPFRRAVEGEFVAATDAFGNRDGDVWLIDWGMEEIDDRLRMTLTREEIFTWNRVSRQLSPYEVAGARFWEMGRKEEALEYLNLTTKAMRDYFPSLHRVLIEERNLIMAARLLDIANQNEEQVGKTLVLVGMAHVGGLKELLREPGLVQSGFEKYGLNYSSPSRMRRVKVN